MPPPVIALDAVGKTYFMGESQVHALRSVSLTVERGEFVAIMGMSGSGKSTLMNILGCLDQPSQGSYRLEGVDIASLDEPSLARIRGQRIGFIFQSFNLLARTSALENVSLPLFYAGRTKGTSEQVLKALAALGLADKAESTSNQMSGGQQQRVAIARALINRPAILLADEPTGNLDSQTSSDILAAIRKLNQETGLTVVLVTHEPEMAAFADRIITLRDGDVLSDVAMAEPRHIPSPPPAAIPEASSLWGELSTIQWVSLLAALRAVGQHKLRAALTMLGIFIGVAALIAMVAVGEGARDAVRARMQSLGTDLLIAMPASSHNNGVRGGSGSASSLTVTDAKAIQEEDSAVAEVSYVNRQTAQVIYGSENWSTSVQGVTPSYLAIRNWSIASGRALSNDDERMGTAVCLLGRTVADNLFGEDADPVGATVIVKSVPMKVAGILAAKGHSAGAQDQDDVVLVPFSTSQQRILGVASQTTGGGAASSQSLTIGQSRTSSSPSSPFDTPPPNPFGIQPRLGGYVQAIYIQARSAAMVPQALDQVIATLERRHHAKVGSGEDDFTVRDLSEISRVMEVLLAAIASISLLVGGIGIMNILLVSVTERTREIGIRMAIGARRMHILLQFLAEAVLLSLVGGGAGVAAGIAAAKTISVMASWPIFLSPLVMLGAFAFSAVVGIFFGFYPARQAARLNPIDALRYE